LRDLTEQLCLRKGQQILIEDGVNNDLLMVKSGALQVTLQLTPTHQTHLRVTRPGVDDNELFRQDGSTPFVKNMTLRPQSYFDKVVRNTPEFGLRHYEVVRVVAKESSVVFRVKYATLEKFAAKESKQAEAQQEFVISKLPGLELKGLNRKQTIAQQFKEIVSRPSARVSHDNDWGRWSRSASPTQCWRWRAHRSSSSTSF